MTWCRGINSCNMIKNPSCYPRWQQYNTCLAAPSVTGKGHCKIEPKAKHFSHCKNYQSSWPNQTDNSKRLAMGELLSFGFNLVVSFPSDRRGSKITKSKAIIKWWRLIWWERDPGAIGFTSGFFQYSISIKMGDLITVEKLIEKRIVMMIFKAMIV